MKRGNRTDVGKSFGAFKEMQGHGSIRAEMRLATDQTRERMVGISYSEPVVIHDGENHLYSIHSWSVTTASHISTLRQYAPGRGLPADTETLHALASGRLSWPDAEDRGRAIVERAAERERAKGARAECVKPGLCWIVSGSAHSIWREGKRWALYATDETGVRRISDHKNLKLAKVAALDLEGTPQRYTFPTMADVRAAQS